MSGELDLHNVDMENMPPLPDWAEDYGRDDYGVFANLNACGCSWRMRWIPPGDFLMGSLAKDTGGYSVGSPQRPITIASGFWLADTLVTRLQYETVLEKVPDTLQSDPFRNGPLPDDAPAAPVEWHCGMLFCAQINVEINPPTEMEFRLPAVTEWEYACRAGTQTALYSGDLTDKECCPNLDPIAWYAGNSEMIPQPVAQKEPNGWGLYDMLGNVWEHCHEDDHDPESYTCVIRGGSCDKYACFCQCGAQSHYSTTMVSSEFAGFRIAYASRSRGYLSEFYWEKIPKP